MKLNDLSLVETRTESSARILWLFEVVKTSLRFFVIGLLSWLIVKSMQPFILWSEFIIFLFASNGIFLTLLYVFRNYLLRRFSVLKFFHYGSLILCLITFSSIITITGREMSDFFLFFVFYLVLIPVVQIDFRFEETVLSELFIATFYPFSLFLSGPIAAPTTFAIKSLFLLFISTITIFFSWILKREHLLMLHANTRLKNMAITDQLTGLFNRRYLHEELSREIARSRRSSSRRVSVILADLDDFKNFNDEFGHLEGDKLLSFATGIFTKETRQMDLVSRFGGEEFVIMLPSTSKQEACRIAERIRTQFAKMTEEQFGKRLTLSFGVATFPEDAREELELLRRADRAMYEAKALGKNRVNSCVGMLG